MKEFQPAWQDAMGTIVEQHAGLHVATQDFLESVRVALPVVGLVTLMGDLVRLLSAHFECEEQLMRRAGFPERHAHHLLHEACLRQFRAELDFLSLGQPRPIETYQEMIRTWIIEHLRGQDRRFEAFLAARGGSTDNSSPADQAHG